MFGFSVRIHREDLEKMPGLVKKLRELAPQVEELKIWCAGHPLALLLEQTADYLERCVERYCQEEEQA